MLCRPTQSTHLLQGLCESYSSRLVRDVRETAHVTKNNTRKMCLEAKCKRGCIPHRGSSLSLFLQVGSSVKCPQKESSWVAWGRTETGDTPWTCVAKRRQGRTSGSSCCLGGGCCFGQRTGLTFDLTTLTLGPPPRLVFNQKGLQVRKAGWLDCKAGPALSLWSPERPAACGSLQKP